MQMQLTKGSGGAGVDIVYEPPEGCKMPPILDRPELRRQKGLIFGYGRSSDGRQENTPIVQQGIVENLVRTIEGTWAGFFCDEDKSAWFVPFIRRPAARVLVYNHLRPGDKFVISKIDRVARTIVDGIKLFQWLHDNGVDVHIANFAGQRLDLTTANGNLMVNILLTFAQFESELRSERVRDTMANMKARNQRYHSAGKPGWKIMPRAIAEAKRLPVQPGRSRTVAVPDETEREYIRTFFYWHEVLNMSFPEIAAKVFALGWKRSNGNPWVNEIAHKNRRTGKRDYKIPSPRGIQYAVAYYRAMWAKHGKEVWDDWTLTQGSIVALGAPKWIKEKLHLGPKERVAAFRVALAAQGDEALPALPRQF